MIASENQSAVARLLQCIEQEYTAGRRGLTGLSQGTSQHAFITAKLERIGVAKNELAGLVGEQEAMQLIVDTMTAADKSA